MEDGGGGVRHHQHGEDPEQQLVHLFGALFEKASLIPGFGSDSYITFLTPGVLVMSALFTAVWNGMDILEVMKRGTLGRFLVTPVWRGALIAGPIANAAVSSLVQAAVIFGVGSLLGAFVGSLIIGFIYSYGQALFPDLAYVILFLPMVLVLTLRPTGLFGRQIF